MAEFWRSSVTAENAPVALLDGRTTSDGFGSACDGVSVASGVPVTVASGVLANVSRGVG
jgi:hypothetical protein